MFRSNFQRTGVYNTTGIRQLKGLKWKLDRSNLIFIFFDCGLTVADGILCLGNWDGNLYGLDFRTGKEVWQYRVGESYPFSPNFFNSNTVVDGTVYISNIPLNSDRENLTAIDLQTGRQKWQFTNQFSPGNVSNRNFLNPISVAVANGVVYFPSGDGNLYSLDAISGDRIGYFRTTKNMPLSHLAVKDNIVCVYSNDGYLYAIDTVTQQQLWKFEIGGILPGIILVPVIANNKVYVVVSNKIIYAIDLETGAEVWNFTLEKARFSQPAITDRFVCLVNNNDLYVLNSETGKIIWTRSLENYLSYFSLSGPVIANNIIYVSGANCLQAIDLDTQEKLWEFKSPSSEFWEFKFWFDLNGEILNKFEPNYPKSFDFFSIPVIGDGIIYVGSAYGSLYALEGF